MEISNSRKNVLNLSLIKKEIKTELDTSQNIVSNCEYDFPTKQEYSYVKEEIDIEWDENYNNHDEGNKLFCHNNDEILKLNTKNINGPVLDTFDQAKKNCTDDNSQTKKFHGRKCKEDMFDKICINCKKTFTNIVDKCSTCQKAISFDCKICHEKFDTLPGIISHLRTKCNILWYYKCSKCGYKSPIKYRMIRHIKRIHSWDQSVFQDKVSFKKVCNDTEKFSLYKCSKCEKVFESYKNLNDHCQYCSESVPNMLDRSMNKVAQELASPHFDNKNSVRKMTMYYCKQCKKESQVENFKINHQQYCLECGSNLMFKCVKCKKQYKLYSSIVYHLKRECNSQKTLQCSECNYTAPLIALINKHYRMTHDRQISFCSTCGGKYKNPESLRKHLYVCTGTIYYRCDECNYKTKDKSNLNAHITRHITLSER